MLAAVSARCRCTGQPLLQHACWGKTASHAGEVLATPGLSLLSASASHALSQPSYKRREVLDPAGPWGATKQNLGSALLGSSTLRLQKQDVSALSLCRSHQWYKNLFNTEGKRSD